MAFALVASVLGSDTSGSGVTTSAIDTTGAQFLLVSVSSYASGSGLTLSDSKSNSWTPISLQFTGNTKQQIYYCASPTVGTGHTVAVSGSSVFANVSFTAWSAGDTVAFESENGDGGAFVEALDSGAVTPSGDDRLIVAGLTLNGTVSSLAVSGGGLAILHQAPFTSGQHMGGAFAYEIQGTAAARSAAWTWTTSAEGSTSIAAFSEGGGGGGGSTSLAPYLYHYRHMGIM